MLIATILYWNDEYYFLSYRFLKIARILVSIIREIFPVIEVIRLIVLFLIS